MREYCERGVGRGGGAISSISHAPLACVCVPFPTRRCCALRPCRLFATALTAIGPAAARLIAASMKADRRFHNWKAKSAISTGAAPGVPLFVVPPSMTLPTPAMPPFAPRTAEWEEARSAMHSCGVQTSTSTRTRRGNHMRLYTHMHECTTHVPAHAVPMLPNHVHIHMHACAWWVAPTWTTALEEVWLVRRDHNAAEPLTTFSPSPAP